MESNGFNELSVWEKLPQNKLHKTKVKSATKHSKLRF